jgi:hypothetical protein
MSVQAELLAERLIAKRYEDLGYAVTTEPPPSAIPFPLGGYQPDILAQRGDEHLIIEVKKASSKVDPKYFQRVDQEIQRHAGWRFLIVTVADEELQDPGQSDLSPNLSLEAIRQHLLQLDQLAQAGASPGMLLPQLWLAYVAAVSLALERRGVVSVRQTDLSLINRAYSEGLISFEEHQAARRFLKLRNEVVHSLNAVIPDIDWRDLRALVDVLLARLPASDNNQPT